MQQVEVAFRWLDPQASADLDLPRYMTPMAAGMDVAAAVTEPLRVQPAAIVLVPTGFAVAIADGYELQVRPRSGLAVKHGITVVNAPGTIDADYRGEVRIALINLGRQLYTIERGDRIAQLILAPVCQARFRVVTQLESTRRGAGGFGHTGTT